jgi:hypothetical protein
MRKGIVCILILSLFAGCKKEQLDDCFSRTGDDKTIERPLKSFNRITVGDKFNVILTQDNSRDERIHITGGSKILEGISAEVSDGELVIENCNTCNFVRSYDREITVQIFLKEISEINIFGAASITCSDTLHLNKLSVFHSALEDVSLLLNMQDEIYVESINSGGTMLAGRAFKLAGSIEEITNLDARNLACEEVIFDTHSPLDCFVNASEIIYVGIFGRGNIYHVGEPSKQKTVRERTGEGNLIKLN